MATANGVYRAARERGGEPPLDVHRAAPVNGPAARRTPMFESQQGADDPLEDLVAQCLEGDATENAAALDKACREHPEHAYELRRRVGALARIGIGEAREEPDFPESLGEFALLERLGGGGMGVVFRARQAQLGREVALKVIRPEQLFFPRARERFRRETEAVARLQHPGIVPIYTVGEDKGVPYFAMELVPGCTLGEMLTQLQGRAPERLKGEDVAELLQRRTPAAAQIDRERLAGPWVSLCLHWAIEIAEALEHAHQRGVLHRDVKPSNVVIGLDGRARLLDFGLASLGDEDQARLTASGATLGSMLYMSPEQLRGESRLATARSDVYALGVTLYELLCLQAPYRDTSLIDLRDAILQGRAEGLRTRNRAVSRDLEVVCLKAMESSPTRRYASAASFARDLRNVLEHRPIEARAPSAVSIAARWVQRNPAASATLALGIAVLVGVPTVLLRQERANAREVRGALDQAVAAREEAERQREAAETAERLAAQERDRALDAEAEAELRRDEAKREALKASEVARLLTETFVASGPAVAQGRELTARDLLDSGLERVRAGLKDQPAVQAELLDAIGSCYSSLSQYEEGERALQEALELRRGLYGERSLHVADSYFGLAHLWRAVGDRRALESAQRARALQLELAPDDPRLNVEYLMCLALSATADSDRPLALASVEQAREELAKAPNADPRLRGNVLANYANVLYRDRRFEQAVVAAREAVDHERLLGSRPHPGLTSALNALALSLKHLGRLEESLQAYDELLEVGRALHGERNDRYATFMMNKAALLEELDRVDEARELLSVARAIFEECVPPAHPQRITVLGNYGGLATRTARWAEGREALSEVLPVMVENMGPRHPRVALTQHYLGLCLEALGERAAAEESLRAALETTLGNYGDDDPRAARLRAVLAALLAREGRDDAHARELAEAALEVARGRREIITVVATAALALARVELRAGEIERARELLEEAVKFGEAARPDHWSAFAARIELARRSEGDAAERRDEAERAWAQLVEQLGATHPECLLGRALLDEFPLR